MEGLAQEGPRAEEPRGYSGQEDPRRMSPTDHCSRSSVPTDQREICISETMTGQRQERRPMHQLNTVSMYFIFQAMRHTSRGLRDQEFASETQLMGVLSVHAVDLLLLKT